MYRLENWGVVVSAEANPYLPPEAIYQYLTGNVYGHQPRFPDGHDIRTSAIVSVDGNKVTTHSGSVYELGKPSEEYVNWCKENNVHVPTEEEPIRVSKSI